MECDRTRKSGGGLASSSRETNWRSYSKTLIIELKEKLAYRRAKTLALLAEQEDITSFCELDTESDGLEDTSTNVTHNPDAADLGEGTHQGSPEITSLSETRSLTESDYMDLNDDQSQSRHSSHLSIDCAASHLCSQSSCAVTSVSCDTISSEDTSCRSTGTGEAENSGAKDEQKLVIETLVSFIEVPEREVFPTDPQLNRSISIGTAEERQIFTASYPLPSHWDAHKELDQAERKMTKTNRLPEAWFMMNHDRTYKQMKAKSETVLHVTESKSSMTFDIHSFLTGILIVSLQRKPQSRYRNVASKHSPCQSTRLRSENNRGDCKFQVCPEEIYQMEHSQETTDHTKPSERRQSTAGAQIAIDNDDKEEIEVLSENEAEGKEPKTEDVLKVRENWEKTENDEEKNKFGDSESSCYKNKYTNDDSSEEQEVADDAEDEQDKTKEEAEENDNEGKEEGSLKDTEEAAPSLSINDVDILYNLSAACDIEHTLECLHLLESDTNEAILSNIPACTLSETITAEVNIPIVPSSLSCTSEPSTCPIVDFRKTLEEVHTVIKNNVSFYNYIDKGILSSFESLFTGSSDSLPIYMNISSNSGYSEKAKGSTKGGVSGNIQNETQRQNRSLLLCLEKARLASTLQTKVGHMRTRAENIAAQKAYEKSVKDFESAMQSFFNEITDQGPSNSQNQDLEYQNQTDTTTQKSDSCFYRDLPRSSTFIVNESDSRDLPRSSTFLVNERNSRKPPKSTKPTRAQLAIIIPARQTEPALENESDSSDVDDKTYDCHSSEVLHGPCDSPTRLLPEKDRSDPNTVDSHHLCQNKLTKSNSNNGGESRKVSPSIKSQGRTSSDRLVCSKDFDSDSSDSLPETRETCAKYTSSMLAQLLDYDSPDEDKAGRESTEPTGVDLAVASTLPSPDAETCSGNSTKTAKDSPTFISKIWSSNKAPLCLRNLEIQLTPGSQLFPAFHSSCTTEGGLEQADSEYESDFDTDSDGKENQYDTSGHKRVILKSGEANDKSLHDNTRELQHSSALARDLRKTIGLDVKHLEEVSCSNDRDTDLFIEKVFLAQTNSRELHKSHSSSTNSSTSLKFDSEQVQHRQVYSDDMCQSTEHRTSPLEKPHIDSADAKGNTIQDIKDRDILIAIVQDSDTSPNHIHAESNVNRKWTFHPATSRESLYPASKPRPASFNHKIGWSSSDEDLVDDLPRDISPSDLLKQKQKEDVDEKLLQLHQFARRKRKSKSPLRLRASSVSDELGIRDSSASIVGRITKSTDITEPPRICTTTDNFLDDMLALSQEKKSRLSPETAPRVRAEVFLSETSSADTHEEGDKKVLLSISELFQARLNEEKHLPRDSAHMNIQEKTSIADSCDGTRLKASVSSMNQLSTAPPDSAAETDSSTSSTSGEYTLSSTGFKIYSKSESDLKAVRFEVNMHTEVRKEYFVETKIQDRVGNLNKAANKYTLEKPKRDSVDKDQFTQLVSNTEHATGFNCNTVEPAAMQDRKDIKTAHEQMSYFQSTNSIEHHVRQIVEEVPTIAKTVYIDYSDALCDRDSPTLYYLNQENNLSQASSDKHRVTSRPGFKLSKEMSETYNTTAYIHSDQMSTAIQKEPKNGNFLCPSTMPASESEEKKPYLFHNQTMLTEDKIQPVSYDHLKQSNITRSGLAHLFGDVEHFCQFSKAACTCTCDDEKPPRTTWNTEFDPYTVRSIGLSSCTQSKPTENVHSESHGAHRHVIGHKHVSESCREPVCCCIECHKGFANVGTMSCPRMMKQRLCLPCKLSEQQEVVVTEQDIMFRALQSKVNQLERMVVQMKRNEGLANSQKGAHYTSEQVIAGPSVYHTCESDTHDFHPPCCLPTRVTDYNALVSQNYSHRRQSVVSEQDGTSENVLVESRSFQTEEHTEEDKKANVHYPFETTDNFTQCNMNARSEMSTDPKIDSLECFLIETNKKIQDIKCSSETSCQSLHTLENSLQKLENETSMRQEWNKEQLSHMQVSLKEGLKYAQEYSNTKVDLTKMISEIKEDMEHYVEMNQQLKSQLTDLTCLLKKTVDESMLPIQEAFSTLKKEVGDLGLCTENIRLSVTDRKNAPITKGMDYDTMKTRIVELTSQRDAEKVFHKITRESLRALERDHDRLRQEYVRATCRQGRQSDGDVHSRLMYFLSDKDKSNHHHNSHSSKKRNENQSSQRFSAAGSPSNERRRQDYAQQQRAQQRNSHGKTLVPTAALADQNMSRASLQSSFKNCNDVHNAKMVSKTANKVTAEQAIDFECRNHGPQFRCRSAEASHYTNQSDFTEKIRRRLDSPKESVSTNSQQKINLRGEDSILFPLKYPLLRDNVSLNQRSSSIRNGSGSNLVHESEDVDAMACTRRAEPERRKACKISSRETDCFKDEHDWRSEEQTNSSRSESGHKASAILPQYPGFQDSSTGVSNSDSKASVALSDSNF